MTFWISDLIIPVYFVIASLLTLFKLISIHWFSWKIQRMISCGFKLDLSERNVLYFSIDSLYIFSTSINLSLHCLFTDSSLVS